MPMTIDEFGRQLRLGQTSATELTAHCLQRIQADNTRLNAFILVMAEEATRQAALADAELGAGRDRGPLHGVPVSLKDLFDVAGTPTTAASRVRDGHLAATDAPIVARLREAGAILIGKTNLHEFAFGTTSEDSAFGPTRNPHDTSRSPGGSSGGSAVSVAAGMALASIGTDTGGSIRIPAAACGTVGLKPSFGDLSTKGVVPLSSTLDHVGPLTATVTDAWLVFHALLGTTAMRSFEAAPPAGLRFAVPRPYFCDLLDPDVRHAFERSLDALRAAGSIVSDVEIANAQFTPATYLHITLGEAARYHAASLDATPERYTRPVRLRLEMGRYLLAEDYVRAMEVRKALTQEADRALSGVDALLLPALAIPAPPIGAASVRVGATEEPVRNVMLRLTQLFNLTGHPAMSQPCGRTAAGLPIGLQAIGARGQTDRLLHVARAIEDVLARSG